MARPPNWDRAWKVYAAIQEDEGIGLHTLTRQLGLLNIGDVKTSLTVLSNHGMLLSEDITGGLYIFGEYGLRLPGGNKHGLQRKPLL